MPAHHRRLASSLLLPLLALAATPPDQPAQLRFDGAMAVQLPLDPALEVGSSYTFQLWIYPERKLQYSVLVRKLPSDLSSNPLFSYLMNLDPAGVPSFGTTAPGNQQSSFAAASPAPLNQWTHIAATCDGTNLTIYINGTLSRRRGANSAPPPSSNYPIHLGAQLNPATAANPGFQYAGFVGFMRQFAMWNRALSQSEIQASMNGGPLASPSGLLAAYPLDDGSGYSLRDTGPNHLAPATVVFPPITTLMNGVVPMTSQPQPRWFNTSLWSATPFDWTRQSQPSVTAMSLVYPIDFDSDGDTDLVTAAGWSPNKPEPALHAYRNDGKGIFTDVTSAVLGSPSPTMRGPNRGIVTDLNHDGRPDLIIGDGGSDYTCCQMGQGQNRVFIQTPDGRLVDETTARMPIRPVFTHYDDGADIDGDGNVDLLFAEINACNLLGTSSCTTLMVNDGSGHFSIDNSRLPESLTGRAAGYTAFLDANRDGFPDIFLGYGETTNGDNDQLLLNDGKGFFREAPASALPRRSGGANCATLIGAVIDLNQDGYPDIVRGLSCVRYSYGGYQVLINRGDGTFADATSQWLPGTFILDGSPQADAFPVPFHFYVADFNGDKRDDLIVSLSGGAPRLYLNSGSRLVETGEFFPNSGSPGEFPMAVGDFDKDGRPDLVIGDYSPGNGETALFVGLNKRDAAIPEAPVSDPTAVSLGPLSLLNEASMSADQLVPGERIRIRGSNLGPASKVAVAEASGVALPTSLGGVTVFFDSLPARLISVSATEIVAQVPFALEGRWLSLVSVSYNGRNSQPLPLPVTSASPQVYNTGCLAYCTADVWKISGDARARITAPGQLKWGDRVAFRLTGVGQGAPALSDDQPARTGSFVPAKPLEIRAGTTPITPVSITYAPDGLAGVVEVVADLPAQQPSSFVFFQVTSYRFTRQMAWPFTLLPDPPTCSYSFDVNGRSFGAQGGAALLPISTPLGCSWTLGASDSWITVDSNTSNTYGGGVNYRVAPNTGAARSGTIRAAGMTFTITQAGAAAAPPPVISSVQDAESAQTALVPGQWAAIYGPNLASGTRVWSGADFTAGISLPTFMAGVTVTFGGKPAAVYYASPTQISVQVPEGISGTVPVVVTNNGASSAPFSATIVTNAPSLFVYPAGGRLFAVATHTDNTLVGDPALIGNAGSKARPGETLVFYVNGLAASPAGKLVGAAPYANPVTVTFTPATGAASTVTAVYAGLSFAGGFQVNAAVPGNLAPGEYKVTVATEGKSSPGGVVLPVGP